MKSNQSYVVVYAANSGNIVKWTFGNGEQRESFSSASYIYSIVNHPTENSLIVVNSNDVYILESNTIIPSSVSGMRDSRMIYETIDGTNHLFLGTIEASGGIAYFRVRKISEVSYPSTYSN